MAFWISGGRKWHQITLKRATINKSHSFASTVQKDWFGGSRKEINAAIDNISEFTGTKIIFWDLRDQFIDNLYKPTVSQSRFEALVDVLDMELCTLCDIIVVPLRDRVVTGLLQASLDGLQQVLLDGGPSRVFFPSDSKLLEEDLESLKEFFISGGQGLPRGMVENLVSRVHHYAQPRGYNHYISMLEGILVSMKLFRCQKSTTRELIDDMKSSSMMGSKNKLGDTEMILRILCHRSDSEASQFLKKQYKLPR